MSFSWLTSSISSVFFSAENVSNVSIEIDDSLTTQQELKLTEENKKNEKQNNKNNKNKDKNKNKKSESSLQGLSNLGQTCFFNASIQALLSCPKFVEYVSILSKKQGEISTIYTPYEPSPENVKNPQKNKTFSQLLLDCYKGTITSPNQLFTMLCLFHPTEFSSFTQSDAHESFNKMMEILEIEHLFICTQKQSNNTINEMFDFIDNEEDDDDDEKMNDDDDNQFNLMKNPFHGLLGSKIECTNCESQNECRQTSFTCLTVSLIDDNRNINNLYSTQSFVKLLDRINAFQTIERVDGYRCQVCECKGISSLIKHNLTNLQHEMNKQQANNINNHNLIKYGVLKEQYNELNDKLNKLNALRPNNSNGNIINGKYQNGNKLLNDESLNLSNKQRSKYRIDISSNKSFRTRALKIQLISRYPNVLCIHLNRLQFGSKITRFVAFPTVLSLNNNNNNLVNGVHGYGVNGINNNYNDINMDLLYSSQYLLMSVIVHHGNDLGGHYTTYRRKIHDEYNKYSNSNNNKLQWKSGNEIKLIDKYSEWLHISDEFVNKVTKQQVLMSQAYMLFYQKNQLSFF